MLRKTYRLAAVALAMSFACLLFLAALPSANSQSGGGGQTVLNSLDPSGQLRTIFTNGTFFDPGNPFFQSLGSNGRSCVTCHVPEDAWTVTPQHLRARFRATEGFDPIFRLNDGANSPNADVSTREARRQAYSMLLTKGVIRVGLPIPDAAEFELAQADDPYGFASETELSLFRRPIPAANLRCLSAVMWDGRETISPIKGTAEQSAQALHADLKHQAQDATTGHAQGISGLTDEQQEQIVRFEMGIATAQQHDFLAGPLTAAGAQGGPAQLAHQPFYIGINDVLAGDSRTGAPFDPDAMALYQAWLHSPNVHRRAVARGAILFNSKPIAITGVAGLNDDLKLPVINGTCTTCHDSPNVGNHSVSLPINIGLADASRRTPDMPLYTLRNKTTGETVQTTDPGRALISGRWKDIGKFKGPILRGLAARAPYFHNGSAATLKEAVDFYDTRFHIGFTDQEKADLVAFLRSL